MFLSAGCIGTIGIFVKLIGPNTHPMTLNFYRLFFAFIFIVLATSLYNKNILRKKVDVSTLKGAGIIGFFMATTFSLLNIAFLYTSVQNATFLNELFPFFVLFFSFFILKEQITLLKIVVLIIASIGLSIINPFSLDADFFGNLIALASAVSNAFLVIYMRKAKGNDHFQSTLYSFLFATILLLPFPFIYGWGDVYNSFWYILGLGFVSTGLSYFLYKIALQHIEASVGSLLEMIITPVVAITLAVVILHEAVHFHVLLGGAILIGAGIFLKYLDRFSLMRKK